MTDSSCDLPDFPPSRRNSQALEDANACIESGKSLIEEIKRTIEDQLDNSLREPRFTLEECHSCIEGQINAVLERATEQIVKSLSKIERQIGEGFNQLHATTISFGLAPPSEEEIAASSNGRECIPDVILEKIVGYLLGFCDCPGIVDWIYARQGKPVPGSERKPPSSTPLNPVEPEREELPVSADLPMEGDTPEDLSPEEDPTGTQPVQPKEVPKLEPPKPKFQREIGGVFPDPKLFEPIETLPSPRKSEKTELDELRQLQRYWNDFLNNNNNNPDILTNPDSNKRFDEGNVGNPVKWNIPWFGGAEPCEAVKEWLPKAAFGNKSVVDLLQPVRDKEGRIIRFDNSLINAVFGKLPLGLDSVFNAGILWFARRLDDVIDFAWSNPIMPVAPTIFLTIWKGLLGFVDKWIGTDFNQVFKDLEYSRNSLAPSEIPNIDESIESFLGGQISPKLLECFLRANNRHNEHMTAVVRARRTKPNVFETISLRRRNNIDDKEYIRLMRENGVLSPDDAVQLWKTHEAWPSFDDVIRFMMRDVDDNTIVQKFGLDDEFESKYRGMTKVYGEGQGIPEELARRYWRAHWQYPSITSVIEMFRRLRPGRVERSLEVTESDVETILAANDYAPHWRKRILAVSYHPLTRTDARRAFMIGSISEEELYETYRDIGYNDRDASILVKFTKDEKRIRSTKLSQSGPVRTIANDYRDATINRQEAVRRLTNLRIEPDVIDQILQVADDQARDRSKKSLLKSYGKAYKRGSITRFEASDYLRQLGLDPHQIAYLTDQWEGERIAREKNIPAAQLCQWRKLGLISPEEQGRRLVLMGYDASDAIKIVEQCGDKLKSEEQARLRRLARTRERDGVSRRKRKAPPLEGDDGNGEKSPGPEGLPEEP